MRKESLVLMVLLVISPLIYFSTLLLYTSWIVFRFMAGGQSLFISIILTLLSLQTDTIACQGCCGTGGWMGGGCPVMEGCGTTGGGAGAGCYLCGTGGQCYGGCPGCSPGGSTGGGATGICSLCGENISGTCPCPSVPIVPS